jgi:NADH dehydrogenase [ubiquinone] 1 alpha subcomplex assembly factor 7
MSIETRIRQIIQQKGSIAMDDAMAIAMNKDKDSYYRTRQPIGSTGDFITSPEVSQMFGEMIGIWIIDIWTKFFKPTKVNIVEYGAGLGTLMRDILRTIQKEKNLYKSVHVWIIDINPILIEEQQKLLADFDVQKEWVESIESVFGATTIVIANEFFDALPVKQYIKAKSEWQERVIIIDPETDKLAFDTRGIKKILAEHLSMEHSEAKDGAVVEESPESIKTVKSISKYISDNEGVALIIDYGYEINPEFRRSYQYTPTLQGIKQHKYIPILSDFGNVDLSAHVDFWAIKKASIVHNVKTWHTVSQGKFLIACGIGLRLKYLIKENKSLFDILIRQYDRLTGVDQMGELFKVIAITSNDEIIPLGFDSVI